MRRLIKNFIAKIFGIKQCQCPPDLPTPSESISSDLPIEPIKITSTNSWGINEMKKTDIVGHCSKHDSYKFSCVECNSVIRN